MKCQKCGAELTAGHLYCDACGAEYQMVPDFEPELETSMAENISGLLDHVIHPDKSESSQKKMASGVSRAKEKKRISSLGLAGAGAVVLIVLLGTFSIRYAYTHSASYLERAAVKACEEGDYTEAAGIYAGLREKLPEDAHWYIEEAKVYQLLGEDEPAEELAVQAVGLSENNQEAEEFLLDFYYRHERWQELHDRLMAAFDGDGGADWKERLGQQYQDFLVDSPRVNVDSGAYEQILSLTLETEKGGEIYYTLDGSKPEEKGIYYEEPIELGNGDHSLRAVVKNSYGIYGEELRAEYHISSAAPLEPTVEPVSGTYTMAQMIQVEAEEGCTVYYTTDGSVPTTDSRKYTGSLPMPLGESSYGFVAVNEQGVMGEVTWCQYMLNLRVSITDEEAQEVLVQKLMDRGLLLDRNGALQGMYGVHQYVYEYPIAIAEENYYVFAEHYLENELNRLTGTYYAVDVLDQEVYGLTRTEDGWQLDPF